LTPEISEVHMQNDITIPKTHSTPTLSEEMLHELSLLTPEDAALFRQIKSRHVAARNSTLIRTAIMIPGRRRFSGRSGCSASTRR
jgi:hypothetical protein